MKRLFYCVLCCAMLFAADVVLRADEGMWMVHLLENGLVEKMRAAGLKLDANVIYDENAASLKDAVVALDFGCTGSMISPDGLMITNHHCAYGDVHNLSTKGHNYLEDGFWAFSRAEEIPIPGKNIYFLKRVVDVTDEVGELKKEYEEKGMVLGGRRLSSIMEKRHSENTECEVSLSSMWKGMKYYMFYYMVYSDVRLVAAPPVSVAAFGNEIDNWEWPQHKCDFAMYRIYTAPDGKPAKYSKDNVPMKPVKYLTININGVKEGDFAMIMGYPGRTNRYNSSFGVDFISELKNPIYCKLAGERARIMREAMDADPAVRLRYADEYFSLTNVQELREGEMMCLRRNKVREIKLLEELSCVDEWLSGDDERSKKWVNLFPRMLRTYKAVADMERDLIYFRECVIHSTSLYVNFSRIEAELKAHSPVKGRLCDSAMIPPITKRRELYIPDVDYNMEKKKVECLLPIYCANVDSTLWGESLREMYDKFGGDIQGMIDYAWENSFMTDSVRVSEFISQPHRSFEYTSDPLYKILHSQNIFVFNNRISVRQRSMGATVSELEREYTHAMYAMKAGKGIEQYPDANSTMRLTWGTVGSFSPRDGVIYKSQSTAKGLLEKENPEIYDFRLDPRHKELLLANPDMPVDFLSNNDITGGNSGSPVLNGKGELVGLAFDGNKESLSGDAYFNPVLNKCVNVDIRYVIKILGEYAGMGYLFDELNIVSK